MREHTTQWVLDNSTDPLDPTEIDWPERQARALLHIRLEGGRPYNDFAQVSPRYGRNDMSLWGENPMADALVTVTFRGVRYVLLIERGDGAGWAMPGGAIEPGEKPHLAALRELQEETGIQLNLAANVQGGSPYWSLRGTSVKGLVHLGEPRWVPDPRGSMEAWAVTVVARCDLGEVDALPEVRGGDDARRAEWWRINAIAFEAIFPAHREILGALR